ncbi:MAG: 3-hydroxyacyl-ACP dehydratase FabZ family protein [Planctomycetota bacterium]|jgi:3-hydroxyacyl-[acyl-carrier-protein] dehydratase
MPPAAFVDLRELDLDTLAFDRDAIRAHNPHRYEFELLHGVVHFDPEAGIIVGEHHAAEDAFWTRGHIPGRPIFPGVLMIETAAQLCSFYWIEALPDQTSFFGFGGIENTRFRGVVKPGDRLVIVAKSVQLKPRRAIFDAQGFVDGKMVFESRIIGVPV